MFFFFQILVLNPDERYTIPQIKANRFFNQIDWDRLNSMRAPSFRPFSGKLVFPEDVLREEEERRRLLHEKLVKVKKERQAQNVQTFIFFFFFFPDLGSFLEGWRANRKDGLYLQTS